MTGQIILASASPRRRELLDQIAIQYHVSPVNLDETPLPGEQPAIYVQRIAAEKSAAVKDAQIPVLAADTTVVLGGNILGKPEDKSHALQMLSQLSGQTHQVYTGVSLRGRHHWQILSVTEVTFKKLSEQEMIAYWDTGEPQDKAGAYAIQGVGAMFVEAISGSFSGVVGLPIFETVEILAKEGITIL